MTLIAGVKGDEFYITMNCGAQAKAKELGVKLDFQGPQEFDAAAADPDRQRGRGQEARRGADRADGHEGALRPDQADGRRRDEDRPRRHDARPARHGRVADRLRQRGRRQDGGGDAGEADRRQRQGLRRQRQAGHLDHGRAREGLRRGRQGGRPRLRRARVLQRQAGGRGGQDQGGAAEESPTSRASSGRTCSRPRAPRPASARRAPRSRSSASTRARSRSRTSRTAPCRR